MLIIFTTKKLQSDDLIMLAYKKYCQIFGKYFEELFVCRQEGKPYFQNKDQNRANVYFSVTHSGEYIFVAVSGKEVGIDLQEHNKKDISAVAKRLYGNEKMDSKDFFDRYACGEAHVKAKATGLIKGLTEETEAINLNIINNYSFAVESEDKDIYFLEI